MNIYLLLNVCTRNGVIANAMIDAYASKDSAIDKAKSFAESQKFIEGAWIKSQYEYGPSDLVFIPGFEFEGRLLFAVVTNSAPDDENTYETWRVVLEKPIHL